MIYVAFNLGEDGSIRIRHISAKKSGSKFRLVVERPETKEEKNREHVANSQKRENGDMNRESTLQGQQHLNKDKDVVAEKQHTNFVQAPDRQHHWEKTEFISDSHVVAGVNLAAYGLFDNDSRERFPTNVEPRVVRGLQHGPKD